MSPSAFLEGITSSHYGTIISHIRILLCTQTQPQTSEIPKKKKKKKKKKKEEEEKICLFLSLQLVTEKVKYVEMIWSR